MQDEVGCDQLVDDVEVVLVEGHRQAPNDLLVFVHARHDRSPLIANPRADPRQNASRERRIILDDQEKLLRYLDVVPYARLRYYKGAFPMPPVGLGNNACPSALASTV